MVAWKWKFGREKDRAKFSAVNGTTLGDLDANGELDIVVGDGDGELRTYYPPAPSGWFGLGASLTLLAGLARWRGRRRA